MGISSLLSAVLTVLSGDSLGVAGPSSRHQPTRALPRRAAEPGTTFGWWQVTVGVTIVIRYAAIVAWAGWCHASGFWQGCCVSLEGKSEPWKDHQSSLTGKKTRIVSSVLTGEMTIAEAALKG